MQTNNQQHVDTLAQESESIQLELSLPPTDGDSTPRSRSKQKSLWPIAILVMVVVAGLFGWRAYHLMQTPTPQTAAKDDQPPTARLPVRAVRAELAPIRRWITSPDSEVRAERFKQLIFESSGEITALAKINGRFLREGDFVRQGQLLATIDDRRYRSDIRAATADQEVAKRSQNQAVASLRQMQANLKQAEADLALAKLEAKRREQLYRQGVVPATDRDTFNNRVVQAEVGVRVAQENVRSAEDQIQAARASYEANKARLFNTVIAREDTQLRAPINGVVAYLNIREGEYWSTRRVQSINSYQDAIESVPIVIVDPNSFEVTMELPAFEGNLIRPNQPVYIALEDDISQAFVKGLTEENLVSVAKARGLVFSVTPAVTPGGRAVQVRVRITEGRRNVRLGERVQAWIAAESQTEAITLPFGAVTTRDRKSYAFVINENTGTVEQRPVIRDIEGLDRISISSGLRPGELVVTEGSNRLVDGSPVEVVNSSSPE